MGASWKALAGPVYLVFSEPSSHHLPEAPSPLSHHLGIVQARVRDPDSALSGHRGHCGSAAPQGTAYWTQRPPAIDHPLMASIPFSPPPS